MSEKKATSNISTQDAEAFKKCTAMKYVDQAKWYLNAYWAKDAESKAEDIFKWTAKFIELDTKGKKAGSSLDEHMAHKFLESIGETLTVLELRAKLRKIDVDCDNRMALLEYLIFRFEKSVHDVVTLPQGGGDNKDKVDAAAAQLDKLMESLAKLQDDLKKQEEALAAQKKQEEEVRKAEEENKAAVEALNKQEAEYKAAIASLEAKIADPNTKVTARGIATQDLAKLKAADPLPLNKAKLTQAASLRRVEKERKAAEVTTKTLEAAKAALEESVAKTEKEAKEAEETLEKLKKEGGTAKGSIWWMEREVKEAQKYLPQKKQTK